jgi:Major intrinsic protein
MLPVHGDPGGAPGQRPSDEERGAKGLPAGDGSASTSFANPAVAIARSLTDTFSGIRPADAPAFILAQLCGAICGLGLAGWLLGQSGDMDQAISPEARL